jgi:hypothetical protein
LPLCHGRFNRAPLARVTVGDVSNPGTGVSGDPLTDVVARVLTVPLRELYAVLWRAGVVEIVD